MSDRWVSCYAINGSTVTHGPFGSRKAAERFVTILAGRETIEAARPIRILKEPPAVDPSEEAAELDRQVDAWKDFDFHVEAYWDEQNKQWDAKVWIKGVKMSEWGDTLTDAISNALAAHTGGAPEEWGPGIDNTETEHRG